VPQSNCEQCRHQALSPEAMGQPGACHTAAQAYMHACLCVCVCVCAPIILIYCQGDEHKCRYIVDADVHFKRVMMVCARGGSSGPESAHLCMLLSNVPQKRHPQAALQRKALFIHVSPEHIDLPLISSSGLMRIHPVSKSILKCPAAR